MQKSLGLIETQGLVGGIEAADAAVKSANVELIGYELTRGGGWTTVKIQGDVGAVKAAVDAARIAASKVCRVVSTRVIPRPAKGLDMLIHNKDTIGDQPPVPPAPPEPEPPQEPEPPAEPEPPVEPEETAAEPEEEKEPETAPVEEAAPVEEPVPVEEPIPEDAPVPPEPEVPAVEEVPAEEEIPAPVPGQEEKAAKQSAPPKKTSRRGAGKRSKQ